MNINHYKNIRKRQTRKYHYFISYSFGGKQGSGFGNVESIRYSRIKDIEDLSRWSRKYEQERGLEEGALVVLNFQLFE